MSLSHFSLLVENISLLHVRSVLTFCWSTVATTLMITVGLFIGSQLSGYHPYNLKFPVNRTSCTCDCWDGYFRGVHVRGGYKTFYINYEVQTIILVGLFLFYAELLRNLLVKIVASKRPVMLLLLPAVYSNFYGTWNLINYLNDHDYHRMLPSQLFFSITELIANYMFYRCLLIDRKEIPIPSWCVYSIGTICSVHIFLAAKELNMTLMRRNIALLIPDLISLVWASILIHRDHQLCPDRHSVCLWLLAGFSIIMFYYIVCPYRD